MCDNLKLFRIVSINARAAIGDLLNRRRKMICQKANNNE